MILVRERKSGNASFYNIETYNEKNQLIFSEVLDFKSSIFSHENGFTYFILYDKNMIPISDVFRFLNYELSAISINSREKALHALKLLYLYETITNTKIETFTRNDVTNLKHFLRGVSPVGQTISFEMETIRSNDTINGYLSIYRNYVTYLEYNESYLLKKSPKIAQISLPGSEIDMNVQKYESSEKTASKQPQVPRYISIEEFKKILKLVREKYGKCEECIIRLMFQAGLRIGEVLGLTGDDIVIEKIESEYVSVVYLRNRVTDQKDQKAKTCKTPISRKEYKSKDYKTEGYGFQRVIIPIDLYELINDYIEETHEKAKNDKHDNYYKFTIADRVRETEEYEDDNYYVFINSQGKPLSSHLWNHRLRTIFEEVGIPVDKGSREHNLNHRFRHGFAMFNVQYLHIKELELQRKLRHRNLSSVAIYYRPTISDEIALKTQFTEDLYNVIPELKLSNLNKG
ncbi:tyrosine-type recombinase/integrase [Heyndrickxia ginsengihumi]|uniref:tyrosine-type recombinase/integrase n=1 Tax=Heyndrickxia ginsengihumi TaxID=363870 RepID=UPI00203F00AF|nr:site-specific integrase [Heyndrickxia ginsengihumi]MCM3024647.1 site-specific integrase [Heyndrickxia ginsengihumi]